MNRKLLTPQQVRQRLVASYLLTLRAQGNAVEVRDVERMVVADLELVDAANRNGTLTGGTPDTKPSAMRPDLLAAAQAQTGTELRRQEVELDAAAADSPHRYRPKALHMNPMRISARWGAAVARISRILEGAAGATLTQSAANAQFPELARQWVEVWGYYMTRSRPPAANRVDHNPFRGLNDRDASRKFMRLVEDICDRSTGSVLGAWYVK